MPRVLITPVVYAGGEGPWREVLESAGFDIVYAEGDCTGHSQAEFLRQLQGVDSTS